MAQAKLTDAIAAKAAPGLHWDTHPRAPKGFLLRVTPAGARAWCLNYRVKDTGRERRITIGSFPAWTTAQARERADGLRRLIDAGGDPLGDLEERRDAPTVAELVERFIAEALPSRAPGTQEEYRSILRHHVLPAIGRHKLAAVRREDVERLHRRISAQGNPRRANSVLSLLSVLFGQAITWGLCSDNPAVGIKRNPEHGRERYLTEEERNRLMATLDRYRPRKPDAVDVIVLAVLTGARRGELLGMRWGDLDLSSGTWSKPPAMTKQRRAHRVPLSAEAVELLRRRQGERDSRVVPLRGSDELVFPGLNEGTFELHWNQVRAAAGLDDLRFHDLRHSYASLLVGQGLSLPIIGAMLGHSKPQTTARYAHLADQPLREAAAIVGKIVGGGKGSGIN